MARDTLLANLIRQDDLAPGDTGRLACFALSLLDPADADRAITSALAYFREQATDGDLQAARIAAAIDQAQASLAEHRFLARFRCRCGHGEAQHAGSRPGGPRAARRGICLADGCDCRQFDNEKTAA